MTEQRRKEEIEEYRRQYQQDNYGMGPARRADVQNVLHSLSQNMIVGVGNPGSLLDVSTGRGETLEFAMLYGFRPVVGTEVVEGLCDGTRVIYAEAHKLPFNNGAFDHVTCFDVLEHLIPEDVEPALQELYRVASRTVTASASFRSSIFMGRELHISRRPQAEWDELIKRHWPGAKLIGKAGGSPCWQVFK